MIKNIPILILFSSLNYSSFGQTEKLVLKSNFDFVINSSQSKNIITGNTNTITKGSFLSFTSFNGIGKLKNDKDLFYYGLILSLVNGISKDQNNFKTKVFQYGVGIQIGKQKFFEITSTIYYAPSLNFYILFSREKDKSDFYPNDLIKHMYAGSLSLMPFSVGFKVKNNLITTLNIGQFEIYYNQTTQMRENAPNNSKGVNTIFAASANSKQFSIGLIHFLNSKK